MVLVGQKVLATEGTSDINGQESPSAVAAPAGLSMTPRAGGSDFTVTFKGVDLSGSVDEVTYTDAKTVTTEAATLKADLQFPVSDGTNTYTEKKLEIKLKNGMGLNSVAGFDVSSNSYNSATLPTELQGLVSNISYAKDPAITLSSGLQLQPTSGVLTYEFTDGLNSTGAITPTLLFDGRFGLHNGTGKNLTITDIITVTATYKKNGISTQLGQEKLEKYTLTENAWIAPYWRNIGSSVLYVPASTQSTQDYAIYRRMSGQSSYGTSQTPYRSVEFTITIPTVLGYQGIDFSAFPASGAYTATSSTSGTNDIVTVKLENFIENGQRFKLKFIPLTTAVPGQQYPISLSNVTYQSDVGDSPQSYVITPGTDVVNVVIGQGDTLTVVTIPGDPGLMDSGDLSADMESYLGQVTFENKTGQILNNQKITVTYPTNVAVSSFTISVPNGATASSAVARYTDGSSEAITIGGSSLATVNSHKEYYYTTSPGKTLSTVEYVANNVPAGSGIRPAGLSGNSQHWYAYGGAIMWGNYTSLSTGDSYSMSASVVNTASASTPSTGAQNYTVVYPNKEGDGGRFGLNSTSNYAGTYIAGQSYNLRFTFNPLTECYPNAVSSKKGFNAFLREGGILDIDPSTIRVEWNGATYDPNSSIGFGVVLSTDNTGDKVYRIEMPNVILGKQKISGSWSNKLEVTVTYSATIQSSAISDVYSAKDYAFIAERDGSEALATGWYDQFMTANKFDLLNDGKTARKIHCIGDGIFLTVQGSNDFTVVTYASLDGTKVGSYDFSAPTNNIINLNAAGVAKYGVEVKNNSSSPVNGFTAMIPLPKAGENTGLIPATPAAYDKLNDLQADDFGWSVGIDQDLNAILDSKYTVTYSTSYSTLKDDTAFVSWASISNKSDIRMIRVQTSYSFVSREGDSFEFPLTINEPANSTNSGRLNAYSARIYRSVSGTAGYAVSEAVAIRLKTGVVKGKVYQDTNRNGVQDAGETTYLSSVQVKAYTSGTTTLEDSTTTDANGEYTLYGLTNGGLVDIVFTVPFNNTTDYRFSAPNDIPDATHLTTTAQAVNPSNNIAGGYQFEHIDAGVMDPITLTLDGDVMANPRYVSENGFPGDTVLLANPTASATFDHWEDSSSTVYAPGATYTFGTSDETLFAFYSSYEITIQTLTNGTLTSVTELNSGAIITDSSGPTGGSVIVDKNKGIEIHVSAATYYEYGGYTLSATADSSTITNVETPDTVSTTNGTISIPNVDRPITVQIDFRGQYQNISFHSDGGTAVPSTQARYGSPFNLSPYLEGGSLAPTLEDYEIVGWYDTSDVTKTDLGSGFTVSVNPNLQVLWKIKQYTIQFDLNGGDPAYQPAPITQDAKTTVDISSIQPDGANEPKWSEYIFLGWRDSAGVGVPNQFVIPKNGDTFTAQWIKLSDVIDQAHPGNDLNEENIIIGGYEGTALPSYIIIFKNEWTEADLVKKIGLDIQYIDVLGKEHPLSSGLDMPQNCTEMGGVSDIRAYVLDPADTSTKVYMNKSITLFVLNRPYLVTHQPTISILEGEMVNASMFSPESYGEIPHIAEKYIERVALSVELDQSTFDTNTSGQYYGVLYANFSESVSKLKLHLSTPVSITVRKPAGLTKEEAVEAESTQFWVKTSEILHQMKPGQIIEVRKNNVIDGGQLINEEIGENAGYDRKLIVYPEDYLSMNPAVLDRLKKDSNTHLEIILPDRKWTFHSNDFTEEQKNFDPKGTFDLSSASPVENLPHLSDNQLAVGFKMNRSWNSTPTLSYKLSDALISSAQNGADIYMFRYNEQTKELELVGRMTQSSNGYFSLPMKEVRGTYIITDVFPDRSTPEKNFRITKETTGKLDSKTLEKVADVLGKDALTEGGSFTSVSTLQNPLDINAIGDNNLEDSKNNHLIGHILGGSAIVVLMGGGFFFWNRKRKQDH